MLGQVYMILHNPTGRMYIGQSSKVEQRIKHHMTMLRAGKHPVEDMQKDFNEFGEDYTITILGSTSDHYTLEIEMMDKYRSCVRGVGYNYKDPHVTSRLRNQAKKRSARASLIKLIDSLDEEERWFSYNLLSRLYENHKRSSA